MSTFAEYSKKLVSEKVTLVTVESAKEARLFTLHSGNIYKRVTEFFISGVKESNVNYTNVASIAAIVPGSFYYDVENKTVYLETIGSVSPLNVLNIVLINKHFFSTAPLRLPYDLGSGHVVEWLPYVQTIGAIGQQLDDEATGIVLESNSSVTFLNDGFFDSFYDTVIWENKNVTFYSWFPNTPVTEARNIFEGLVESKDYGINTVSFKVKDFIFRLRDKLSQNTFTGFDGSIADSIIGSPKRRIYGQVKQLQAIGTDLLKDGFLGTGTVSVNTTLSSLTGTASGTYLSNDITGTVTGNIGTNTITGTGTNFTTMLSINDKIRVTNGTSTFEYTVLNIASATSLTVTQNITATFTAFTAKNASRGNRKIYGIGTSFLSQAPQGSTIRFTNGTLNYSFKIESIESDIELTVSSPISVTFTAFTMVNDSVERNVLTGVGTSFLNDLSVGDTIRIPFNGGFIENKVDAIPSATTLILTDAIIEPVINSDFYIKPEISYWKNNRNWHIAGHKLREPTTTITAINSNNRFILASVADIYEGDRLLVNGSFVVVRRIVGNELVTQTAVSPLPLVGDTVKKLPVQNVFFGLQEMVYSRDWTYTNTTECKIQFNTNAEFNVTNEKFLGLTLEFKNGSNVLSTSSVVDLRTVLKARDRIRKNSIVSGEGDFYEISFVKEQEIILRTPYTGTTEPQLALYKSINFIKDDSLITVNCLGYEDSGLWLRTPSDAVRHMILNDAGFLLVNEASFLDAKNACDYTVSIVSPPTPGGKPEAIRDVITKINESVFGSLYGDSSNAISYSILNSDKPVIPQIIGDDDIISYGADSYGKFYNVIVVNYRPFVDQVTGKSTTDKITYDSDFVNNFLQVTNTLEKDVYLYEESKAQIMAERLALFNSLSRTKVTLRGKMNFFLNSINDRITLNLDRLFARYSSNDRRRIGVVTGIKRSQSEVELVLSDLGNIFNRIPSIAPSTAVIYTSASNDDKLQYGYILDNNTFTPETSSEQGLGSTLIG